MVQMQRAGLHPETLVGQVGNQSPSASPETVPNQHTGGPEVTQTPGAGTDNSGAPGSNDLAGSHCINNLGQTQSAAVNAIISELEDQLAEALYRRAQTKLMIDCFLTAGTASHHNLGNSSIPAEGFRRAAATGAGISTGLPAGGGGGSGSGVITRRPAEQAMLEAALQDALRAAAYIPSDDEFQLLISSCYIRLSRFQEARQQLAFILARNPTNQRAQFHLSFVQQESGLKKDAIETLTKIIASSSQSLASTSSISGSSVSKLVNPGRVMLANEINETSTMSLARLYECRGTLFHEIQVHKLALIDLGRAIALDPSKAENYFLRGDCHSKLGSYEQALADFEIAIVYGYKDPFSLLCTRGIVYRLLGQSDQALGDFNEAMKVIDLKDKVAIVRITTLTALCLIDLGQFAESCELLSKCLEHVRVFIEDACVYMNAQDQAQGLNGAEDTVYSPSPGRLSKKMSQRNMSQSQFHTPTKASHPSHGNFGSVAGTSNGRHSPDVYSIMTSQGRTAAHLNELNLFHSVESGPASTGSLPPAPAMSLTAARKLEWILLYHQGLCLYNQGYHAHVEQVLLICLHPANALFAPDDHSVSKVQFFLALSYIHLEKFDVVEEILEQLVHSSWITNNSGDIPSQKQQPQPPQEQQQGPSSHQSLLYFIWGKLHQRIGQHVSAVDYFTKAIEHNPQLIHAYFRRAWSYKALQRFDQAGEDFETAKHAMPDDPNFSVNYKSIARLEYMQIDSEPDIVLLFPPLLPNNL
jgi:tetratricopeptide (TPR) repeat protein